MKIRWKWYWCEDIMVLWYYVFPSTNKNPLKIILVWGWCNPLKIMLMWGWCKPCKWAGLGFRPVRVVTFHPFSVSNGILLFQLHNDNIIMSSHNFSPMLCCYALFYEENQISTNYNQTFQIGRRFKHKQDNQNQMSWLQCINEQKQQKLFF